MPGDQLLLANVGDYRHQPHRQVDVGQLHAHEHHRPVVLGHVQRDLSRDRRLARARGRRQQVQRRRQPQRHRVQVAQPRRDTRQSARSGLSQVVQQVFRPLLRRQHRAAAQRVARGTQNQRFGTLLDHFQLSALVPRQFGHLLPRADVAPPHRVLQHDARVVLDVRRRRRRQVNLGQIRQTTGLFVGALMLQLLGNRVVVNRRGPFEQRRHGRVNVPMPRRVEVVRLQEGQHVGNRQAVLEHRAQHGHLGLLAVRRNREVFALLRLACAVLREKSIHAVERRQAVCPSSTDRSVSARLAAATGPAGRSD